MVRRAVTLAPRFALALTFALTSSVTGAALAEPPPSTPSPEAAAHVSAGDRARLDGRFTDAETSYRRALAFGPDDATSLRLAMCLSAEGKLRDAADLLERLATPKSSLAESDRSRAEAALADARRELGTIELHVDDGAFIELDGVPLGAAPLGHALHVHPGPHAIRASRKGYDVAQAIVDARSGHAYVAELPLRAVPADPIRTTTEETPSTSPLEEFQGSFGLLRGAGMIFGATLLVGGGAAIGIAHENDDLVSAYRHITQMRGVPSCFDTRPKADPDCRRLAQSIDASAIATTAAAVLFTGAGAVIGATALTWLLPPARPSRGPSLARAPEGIRPSVTLTATVTPMSGGLSLEASW